MPGEQAEKTGSDDRLTPQDWRILRRLVVALLLIVVLGGALWFFLWVQSMIHAWRAMTYG